MTVNINDNINNIANNIANIAKNSKLASDRISFNPPI